MPTLVSKFGGSSTANADCFRQVWRIVRASPARRCVVLSAPGTDARRREKVTALLEKAWRDRDARSVDAACARFGEIAETLGVSGFAEEARREIEGALGRSEAATVSRGEYLCARLFSRCTGVPMADAAEVVRFDADGRLDAPATAAGFIALSRKFERVVVPGFYGADPSGSLRLFPRNGSDITGALAAAGMGAGLYENWTDVPGLMTADPAVVPEARLIPQISYRQMRALARAGARVLHPACLDPVAMAGIPTRLRCTMRPAQFGTLIDDRSEAVVPCLAAKVEGGRAGISVFGIPVGRVREAAKDFDPDGVEDLGDRVEVRVGADALTQCVRALHRRLIDGRDAYSSPAT